jgi:hypothetical protein
MSKGRETTVKEENCQIEQNFSVHNFSGRNHPDIGTERN